MTHKKNGYFTPEYVVVGFCDKSEIYKYYNNTRLNINIKLVEKAWKDPYVYHFIMHLKPWKGIQNKKNMYVLIQFQDFMKQQEKLLIIMKY